jgi:hypothetical protein
LALTRHFAIDMPVETRLFQGENGVRGEAGFGMRGERCLGGEASFGLTRQSTPMALLDGVE